MRLMLPACLAVLFLAPATLRAQVSSQSYLRNRPNEIERDDPRVQSTIERAEQHFKLGELNLKDSQPQAARAEFDKAVDSVLESGMDVRSNQRLQKYYLELVERVYRMEVPQGAPSQGGAAFIEVAQTARREKKPAPPTVGFVEQKFVPSPLEELSKIVLTRDELETSVPKPCNADGDAKLELRGFQIGMSAAEVKRRLPTFKLSAPDKHGAAGASIVLGSVERRDPLLKDVRGANFTFLDGRVSAVTLFYNNTARWESTDQFSAQVAEAMNLTSDWRYLGNSELGMLSIIRCEGVSVVAGLTWISRGRFPVISLRDERALATVTRRVKDEEVRKQRAEEERRRSFKP